MRSLKGGFVALVIVLGPASGADAATLVTHWSPFVADGSLRSGLVAAPAYGGRCFTGSFAVHGAYRCSRGSRLQDPCFEDPTHNGAVVCVGSPFARTAIRLRVVGELQGGYSADASTVWAIRLATGQRCMLFAGGATGVDAAGRRANYGCGGRRTVLWGGPIRTGRTWRIRMSHSFAPGPEQLVAVREAFIGVG